VSGIKKLLDANIIFQVRHFAWVANLVPVRKNSRDIHLCVVFKNLNRASEKDNYIVSHVITRIQPQIASKVSPVPISFNVTMNNFKEFKWAQTQDNIVLTQKTGPTCTRS
jgi:hypothetical protein